MNEIIEQYCNQKFMLSMIFDKSIASGMSQMNYQANAERFFTTETLYYLKDTITSNDIVYDSYKLDLIKEYLIGYVALYGSDETKSNIINLCKEILHVMLVTNQRGLQKFYQYEWELRTNNDIEAPYNKIQQIDKSISLDYTYIRALLKNESMIPFKEDINCLLSLNAFTVECPILFIQKVFLDNVKKIIEFNEQSTNSEVQVLSRQIADFIKNLEMDHEEISKIYQEQSILSLIFSPYFEEELDQIDKNIGDSRFYTKQRFQVFKKTIIEGTKNCIFNTQKRDYAYILLRKFSNILNLSNMEQNEIKLALNQYENDKYKLKNIYFYINCYNLHHSKRFQFCDEMNYDIESIEQMIYYDSYVLRKLVDPDLDITELATFRSSIYSINYIINSFPVIAENPIYFERISNLLELNDMIYSVNGETSELKEENSRTLKKIKKL